MTVDDLFYMYAMRKDIDYKSLDPNLIKELLDRIMNDKNSSMARESVILKVAGYNHLEGKLDYDGYKDDELAEVKLRNFDTTNLKSSKLNGEGSYSDYTWERYEHHLQDNPTLLIGGFVNGELIYVFKTKYSNQGLQDKIIERLTSYFGDKSLPRKPNTFLRSLGFNYSHYKDDCELIFIASDDVLNVYEKYINKKLLKDLRSLGRVG